MNAFMALDEILRETGGIPLTKDLVRKLLSRFEHLFLLFTFGFSAIPEFFPTSLHVEYEKSILWGFLSFFFLFFFLLLRA